MPKSITSFSGEHSFLSNFYPAPVKLDGYVYPTVEHAFQAAKSFIRREREAIRLAPSPGKAKRLGRKVILRPDWEHVKIEVMKELLRQKFSDPELCAKLLATGDASLIEGNHWGDVTWGCVLEKEKWVGSNKLGVLLMELRFDLREEVMPK